MSESAGALFISQISCKKMCNLFTHSAPRSSKELVQKRLLLSEFCNVGFSGEGKFGLPGEKPLGAE